MLDLRSDFEVSLPLDEQWLGSNDISSAVRRKENGTRMSAENY